MKIIIGSDLVPTSSNLDLFIEGNIEALLGEELLKQWSDSDVRIFNLEVPLADIESPIAKYGPNLIAPTSAVNGIKALKPTVITLANNHILDQGVMGLNSTTSILSENNIPYVGVGNNLFEASKPYVIKKDGSRIGLYACAEHEFTIATECSPGANPFDPLESLDHISRLKSETDFLIILYHGGKEHYRYPSPYLQKVCRKMVQKGADLVVCQHSHCIGCFEEYQGSTIVYGQGNFLFDNLDNDYWRTSLLIKVNLDSNCTVDYVPMIKMGNGVRLAVGYEAEKILKEFHERSNEILQDGFIKKNYQKFAEQNRASYLRKFAGFSKWMTRIDRRLFNGFLLKRKFDSTNLLAIRNYIECEAHRELVLEALKIRE